MNLNELRNKRGRLIQQCREMLSLAENEKRELTTEESAKYDTLFSESQTLGTKIQREEKLLEEERVAGASTRAILDPLGGENRGGNPADAEKRYQDIVRPAIGKWFSRGKGVSFSGEEARALQADLDVQGGYLKPPMQFIRSLIKAVDDQLFIRQLATVHQITEADSMGAPSLTSDPGDSEWTGEITEAPEDSSMAFGKRELKPHALKKLLKVSNKLLRLTADAEKLVRDRLAYKLALPQEKGFLTGSGAGQPLGVFTASTQGISTGRDVSTGNSGTEIAADNLIEQKYSLKAQYHGKAQWLGHRDWVKRVAKLKDSEGQYLWQAGLQAGQPDRLLGFPVNMTENGPSTFTTGLYTNILGDFSFYWIAEVLAMEIKRLDELYARTGQTGFIVEAQVDGMPVLEEAFVRGKMG
jgi:HK97 family phage major capsid protein